MTAPDLNTEAGRAAWTEQTGVAPLCGLVWQYDKGTGCRRPYGHEGNCDARLGESSGWGWPEADPLAAGERRDDELRREERT